MKLSLKLPLVVLLSHVCFAADAQDIPILPSPSKIAESIPAEITQSTQAQSLTHSITATEAASMRSSARRMGEEPVEVISIDTRKLRTPADAGAGGEVLSLNGGAPDAVPLVLEIAGSKFMLAWVGEQSEPTRAYRYVSMGVLNHPDAYARFTVMGDAVIGTIVTREVTYRILPTAGGQAVYRLGSADTRRPAKLRRVAPTGQDVVATMERRHVQLEQISDIQPWKADLRDVTHLLWISGGRLASLSGEVTPAKVAKLLRDLSEISYAPTNLQIKVTNLAKNAQGAIVTFRQVLNGIEVLRDNRIETNTAGEVTKISTQLFDDSWAVDGQLLSKAEAQGLALKAIEAHIKEPLRQYELTQPTTLFYLLQTPEVKLLPFYEFHVQAPRTDGLWSVTVNARSGEARIAANPQEFGWWIGRTKKR